MTMDNLVADGKLIASQVIVNRGRTSINTIIFFIFLSFLLFGLRTLLDLVFLNM